MMCSTSRPSISSEILNINGTDAEKVLCKRLRLKFAVRKKNPWLLYNETILYNSLIR